ncbi:hypothetical protein J6590_108312 [Homalodisca vitripennis]|nr:hypothetical protein J6590_108312 [Homalodisca vitripennis]
MESQKKCTKCQEFKDFEAFYKNKNKKEGLGSMCKDCRSKYERELYEKIEKFTLEEKECCICKEIKNISEFHNWHYSKDKKQAFCKDCARRNFRESQNKPTHCECGRTLQWLPSYAKHLQTKYHKSRV